MVQDYDNFGVNTLSSLFRNYVVETSAGRRIYRFRIPG